MNCLSWGVLLAGGDGTRLLPLTRRLFGDDRPKQFSPLFRNRTLLALTRERVAGLVPLQRTLFALVERHRPFYEPELSDVNPSRLVVQPYNRGTSAAIIYSLLRISRMDPEAVVAFFPTDHYYADESMFIRGAELACETVRQQPEFVVLMGATPEWADADYGWIEPGLCVGRSATNSLFRVNRFWEKPSRPVADKLHRSGCLLNTFVMTGTVKTFIELLRLTIPDALAAFTPLAQQRSDEMKVASRIYSKLIPGDFSHQVLSACASRLLVLRLADAGWSDLGTEDRVNAIAARQNSMAAHHQTASVPEPQTLEAFHAWLDAYRKRLADLYERSASQTPASVQNGTR
jgi:mannose-1-phosphate guanylyltransferase